MSSLRGECSKVIQDLTIKHDNDNIDVSHQSEDLPPTKEYLLPDEPPVHPKTCQMHSDTLLPPEPGMGCGFRQ